MKPNQINSRVLSKTIHVTLENASLLVDKLK